MRRTFRWIAPVLVAGAIGVPTEGVAQASGEPGRVTGRVVDQETGDWLTRAFLEVVGTDIKGPASPDGRFMLPPLRPGQIELRLTHPGFQPRTEILEVLAGQTLDLRIGLVSDTIFELAPLSVEVRSRVLERRGFYDRQAQGYAATYFTRDEIEERNAQNLSELFTDVPGMRLIPGGLDGPQLVFTRATDFQNSGVCRPALFMDGVKSGIRLYDMILDPTHVEGIELYVGSAIPGQYNDSCGAVLIWTR
ncbi:MAG TPA: carboxypeptidase regulatory-like domain-containing protein [Longimicrobiales bacterium]|nr:carboxypeptidase regulatory-like domain-containing protein [Longimicrobiales bacterium]